MEMDDFKITITPTPQSCIECPMCVDKGWGDLEDYCYLTGKVTWDYKNKRREDCPLAIKKTGKNCELFGECPCGHKRYRNVCPAEKIEEVIELANQNGLEYYVHSTGVRISVLDTLGSWNVYTASTGTGVMYYNGQYRCTLENLSPEDFIFHCMPV